MTRTQFKSNLVQECHACSHTHMYMYRYYIDISNRSLVVFIRAHIISVDVHIIVVYVIKMYIYYSYLGSGFLHYAQQLSIIFAFNDVMMLWRNFQLQINMNLILCVCVWKYE